MGSTLAKIKIRGRSNLPQKGPYVVACNHFSDYDPLFFSYAIRQPINFIAASDQEVDLVFAWAPYIYGWIPVDRKKLSPSWFSTEKANFPDFLLRVFINLKTLDKSPT